MIELSKFRYPGAKNFTTEQAHLFMGRDDDKEKLYQMITARQIVVLYGKSGMGKSSLLNAGIIPILENELDRKPKYFSIRLFNKGQEKDTTFLPPLQTLIQTVSENAIEKEWLKPLKVDTYPKGELWYWLKQWQIEHPRVPIILFFDQFEELFSYSDTEIEEFGDELRTLIYQNIPDYISRGKSLTALEQMAFVPQNEKERLTIEKQINSIYEKIDIKLVFSIRSDRMALLNKLTKYIPNILKHFYELNALTEEDAREAIKIPAQLEGDFQIPAFQYQDKVVDAIIERVKNNHDGKIETATLQIICRFIELQRVSPANSTITLNDLGNIKDIFKDFYQTSLNKLNKEEKAIASKTIEERFIQNNQRIPFAGEYLKLEDKWTDNLLKQLEESTLLRKERDTAGRFIYEIGHDTLIEPILEFAKIREQEEKQKRLRKNIAIVGAIALLFLCIIFYVLSLKQEAQQSLYQLYYQQAKTVKDNGDNILRNKDTETAQYYYDSAKVILEKIPETDSIALELKSELQKLLKK